MPSLIPGYNYDIFISYRQKDNKGERWVSEFVEALKTELESTFKDEISVYFDINPHDGLLETHDVDASLREKLRCLIFIPIISRTYCDPKSFAWEHEFKAFIEKASNDQLGLKVKLPNGNVASRVLPIQIHDLKPEDKVLVEKEIGGFIRAIEFIYKEAGVNRSLTPKDSEDKNTNKTNYRNQINKVANAIDEIISGLIVAHNSEQENEISTTNESLAELGILNKKEVSEKPTRGFKLWLLTGIIGLVVLLIVAVTLAYPKILISNTPEKLRSSGEKISVAVMPFQNMIGDSSMNIYSSIIQTSIVKILSNFSEEIIIRQTESINTLIRSNGLNYYSFNTPSTARNISKKVKADVFIMGNMQMAGNIIRVNAQLINSNTEEVYKSFPPIEAASINELNYKIIDSLSMNIKDFLILSQLKQKCNPEFRKFESTNSLNAFIFFSSGYEAFQKTDFRAARESFSEAIKHDSTYILAYTWLATTDINLNLYDEGLKYCKLAYKKVDRMAANLLKLKLDEVNAWYTYGPPGRIKYLKQLIDLDDQNPSFHSSLGHSYRLIEQYEKAIPEFEKTIQLKEKWDLKPTLSNYTSLGYCYHKTGKFKKEKSLYKKANKDYPDNSNLNFRQFILALTEGDTTTENKYYKRWRLPTWAKGELAYNLAGPYFEAGILDKAEVYYRQCLSFEPEGYYGLRDFSYFLIETNRNIDEGMVLINRAIKLFPDDAIINDVKGWGLYKQGKYEEALNYLEKSASLSPWYNHRVYLHIVATKKAIADQKKNN